ncbi:MAG: hypothetical protein SOV85_01815 [Clostridium sp.]|uniref:hypothetical protein n=1 Tax=Clostridium sp. TaxID=1506 RepID=UPI002A75EC8E|nr:hypothetical protein [Clostridium sp.]MDY2630080.1 hypothetical protein [Clostridium sp.]
MVKIKIFNNCDYVTTSFSYFENSINNFLKSLKEEDVIEIKPYGYDNVSIMVVYRETK